MVTREEISMAGFEIVAYAGDAKTALMNALDEAQKGNYDKAREFVKSADVSLNDAHNSQTRLMSKEASGEEMETTFIMSHGQDTLMTTMLLRDQAKYFIDLYEKYNITLKELEQLKKNE
ncbi:PTS lactose/cellobiose transporter subunit IIA [Lactobacillus sp. ESL0236]|uniref:PTS lactose/cellobiose transporter subunit IIA n=1 Tax=unclassified Lactobacillus TaxID=2620435 RepID=UPI000EFCF665|nr:MULTISPECIES: PTS lactose/cellobiose transporter subunit IIA [unclassified Lactobacillus]RMC41276.1 PTS lactose/cellobiose transporter subunit IIA [Lactobacillus sp. ESL0237]RMC45145.1 PTS lactose/cellobiose transporter subunit IIA [Lactobacillus sp. ESL0234]RMC45977.1 PTS lactose/cellobiose transporter subunit IIA [Lactobacillus sp. ESL0236]